MTSKSGGPGPPAPSPPPFVHATALVYLYILGIKRRGYRISLCNIKRDENLKVKPTSTWNTSCFVISLVYGRVPPPQKKINQFPFCPNFPSYFDQSLSPSMEIHDLSLSICGVGGITSIGLRWPYCRSKEFRFLLKSDIL